MIRRGEKQAKEPVGGNMGGGGVKVLDSMGGSRKALLNLAAFNSFSETKASASVHAVTQAFKGRFDFVGKRFATERLLTRADCKHLIYCTYKRTYEIIPAGPAKAIYLI